MRSLVRVFVVEDSPLIRKRIIENLQSLGGFDVVGFAEAEDAAVAAIVAAKPDVVITDIRLKEGNGIEVVRQLRENAFVPQPRIYVLSNYANVEYRRQCELVGADDFFDKSGEYDRFLDALRHYA
ncbi:MAG TPA: response regulator [Casimicrobiaceae bacterium]|jgi:DNA-binding NarL/FixJ family response regulator|nr:response regulator [Casimicrobiaceae bacterium]